MSYYLLMKKKGFHSKVNVIFIFTKNICKKISTTEINK